MRREHNLFPRFRNGRETIGAGRESACHRLNDTRIELNGSAALARSVCVDSLSADVGVRLAVIGADLQEVGPLQNRAFHGVPRQAIIHHDRRTVRRSRQAVGKVAAHRRVLVVAVDVHKIVARDLVRPNGLLRWAFDKGNPVGKRCIEEGQAGASVGMTAGVERTDSQLSVGEQHQRRAVARIEADLKCVGRESCGPEQADLFGYVSQTIGIVDVVKEQVATEPGLAMPVHELQEPIEDPAVLVDEGGDAEVRG